MCSAIADRQFRYKEIDLKVTVSIGGSMKTACDEIGSSIQAADAALYQAKTGGRNLTIFASGNREQIRIMA